jgi:O-antigen ligase
MGNAGPLNTIYIFFFAALLFVHKKIKWITLIPLMVFAFAVIAMSATRKAFGAAVIITLTFIISQIQFSAKNIILVLVLSAAFYFGGNYAIENTALRERFDEGVEYGEGLNTTGIEALDLLGDRVGNYIIGWDIFKDNPLTGIGLTNYKHKGHGLLLLHTEYMVQLTECGIIGTILFLLFYFWIGKHIILIWRKNPFQSRPALWILAGGFCAVLFINLTAWTYEFDQYFAVFGVMIGYIKIFTKQ